jgi:hypothetical protein
LSATLLFPTPPLPDVTAIALASRTGFDSSGGGALGRGCAARGRKLIEPVGTLVGATDTAAAE